MLIRRLFSGPTFYYRVKLPMKSVFSRLIDASLRVHYVPGVKDVEVDAYTERIGSGHKCIFDDITFDFKTIDCNMNEEEIIYVEDSMVIELGVKMREIYTLKNIGDGRTKLIQNVNMEDVPALTEEIRNTIMTAIRMGFENFKNFCEGNELQY